jgi:hypothetical protein
VGLASLTAGVLLATTSFAQTPATAPADAPVGATGLCKDGTYWTNASKRGACHDHKGIQAWYGAADYDAANPGAAPAAQPGAPQPMQAAPKALPPPMQASATAPMAAPKPAAGMVWVNTSSKVYHCPADSSYGKTKKGAYMSEADAKAAGNRPAHGKACS